MEVLRDCRDPELVVEAALLIFLLIVLALPSQTEASSDTTVGDVGKTDLRVSFTFSEPRIEKAGSHLIVSFEGIPSYFSNEGLLLPYRTAKVLLPPASEFSGYEVSCIRPVLIGSVGSIDVRPEYYPTTESGDDIGREQSSYSNIPGPYARFPAIQAEYTGTELLEGLKVALFRLCPLQFDVVEGGVSYFLDMELIVHVRQLTTRTVLLSTDIDSVLPVIDNPDILADHGYYQNNSPQNDPKRYLIVTSDALTDEFSRLADWKTSRGADQPLLVNSTSGVFTVEWIKSNPSYWGDPISHGGKGNDTQTQIRNFIKDAHGKWGTESVLLGGDDEIIPARLVRVTGQYSADIPADIYYSGLDGDWDTDNDGVYGEGTGIGGGLAGDEADLLSEIGVGRATVDNVEEAANFVSKDISYERNYAGNYLNKSLMVGNKLDDRPTWGGDYKDEVVEETFPTSNPDLSIQRLYEEDGTFSKGALLSALNQGVHIVNHMGHGSTSSFADLTINDVESLSNSQYFVLYSQACNIGAFDEATSGETEAIAEHFTSSDHGAVAMIVNSRYGWYSPGSTNGPSQAYDIQFFDAIFNQRIRSLGDALSDSKEDLASSVGSIGAMRWCYMAINLLGDPETSVHFIEDRGHDIALSDLTVSSALADQSCVVSLNVRNLGSRDEAQVPVELIIDGGILSTSFVSVPAGGATLATFAWIPQRAEPTIVTVHSNLTSDQWTSNDMISAEVDVAWGIKDDKVIESSLVTLGGNLFIESAGRLRILNSTIIFNSSWNHHFSILVDGSIEIRDSLITCDGDIGYSLLTTSGSEFIATNVSFERCRYHSSTPGFQLKSDMSLMRDSSLRSCDGLNLIGVTGADIIDLNLTECNGGLNVEDSIGVEIIRLDVTHADVGLEIANSTDVHVLDCEVHECDIGLVINGSEALTLFDNEISGNQFDFGISGSMRSHFVHEIGSNNVTAGALVYLIDLADATIDRSGGDIGCLVLVSCANISVSSLDLQGNVNGLLIFESTEISVTKCKIDQNLVGMRSVSSSDNVIYRNDFVSNGISAWDDGDNRYNVSYPLGGNFWSDYLESDDRSGPNQDLPNPDGVGDMPYAVRGGSCLDHYPFMKMLTDGNHIPVARYSYDPSNPSSFDIIRFIDSSVDSDGMIVNWTWDFGDGSIAYSRNVTHSYSGIGDYKTTLVVRDDESEENATSKIITVRNRLPQVSFSFFPDFPAIGETVNFSDQSVDLDGYIVARTWDFGDGVSSSEVNPPHAFTSKGVYTVKLSVTDDAGAIVSSSSTVPVGNELPVAQFTYSPSDPTTQTEVHFIDNSTDSDGYVASRSWDFGDGSLSFESNPKYRYLEDGFYVVTLVVSDDVGARDTERVGITILNARPLVSFDWTPDDPSTSDLIEFIDLSIDVDGTMTGRHWEFGDGSSSDDAFPAHRFADNGQYMVNLTVWDDDGAVNTSSREISIGNSPPNVSFDMSDSSPQSLENISFTDRSVDADGAIVSWNWSFGDGNWSSEKSPTFRYSRSGEFLIRLSVVDDDGDSNSTQLTIHVRNLPPLSDFTWVVANENSGTTVDFTSIAVDRDGSIAQYQWVFGDGATSSIATPVYSFQGEGNYSVTLTVTDNSGDKSSCSRLVVVSLPDLVVTQSGVSIYPDDAGVGDNVTFSVTVRNDGSRAVHGAAVVFLLDEQSIGVRSVDVSPHSTVVASLLWTATSGSHLLRVEVDGEDAIQEGSDINNWVEIPLTITKDASGLDPFGFYTGMMLLSAGVVIVVAIAILLRARGKSLG